MIQHNRVYYAGRRLFGAVKRPIFDLTLLLTGRRLQGAAEYRDFGMYGGMFEAPSESVTQRISPGFEVVERRPGWTELEIWAADYRRVDILEPYRELAVLVPVRLVREGQPAREGSYVSQMVVTSEEARWTGVEIHGFPKYVADVSIAYGEGLVECACRHRGVHVLTLRVDVRSTSPFEDRVSIFNVRRDGRMLRTDFERGGERGESAAPAGVTLELGEHAVADQLRQMGLRRDFGRALYLPHCHGILHRAVDVGAAASARVSPRRTIPTEQAPRRAHGRPAVA